LPCHLFFQQQLFLAHQLIQGSHKDIPRAFIYSGHHQIITPTTSVHNYQYSISVKNETKEEHLEFSSNTTELFTFNLIPETEYQISVCSEINYLKNCSIPLRALTTQNACSNLQILSSQLHLGEFSRNEQGGIVALASCEHGYSLIGDETVKCNDSIVNLPQCSIISCLLPHTPHAHIVQGSDSPEHFDTQRVISLILRCESKFPALVCVPM
jgi:hypothetical protein